jgi:uncharacterized Zn finger protein
MSEMVQLSFPFMRKRVCNPESVRARNDVVYCADCGRVFADATLASVIAGLQRRQDAEIIISTYGISRSTVDKMFKRLGTLEAVLSELEDENDAET